MNLEHRLGIKEGERLAAVARAAGITLLPVIVLEAAVFAAPFFFLRPLLRWQTLGYIIIGMLLFLGAFLAARSFAKWYGSFLAATDRRLIIVRREGLFSREVTEITFDKVHEIAFHVRGLGATIFGFGSLLIESAASNEPLEMRHVLHPQRLHRIIAELKEQAAGGPGDFGSVLQAVSHYDDRKLQMLKAEIERTMKSRV